LADDPRRHEKLSRATREEKRNFRATLSLATPFPVANGTGVAFPFRNLLHHDARPRVAETPPQRKRKDASVEIKRTILIIDDDPLARESYRELLETEGFPVAEASNGAEAILWLQRRTADLILLDLKMPVMDGRSFLEYRLRDATVRDVPVLVVSSWLDDPGIRQILERLGADQLLQKPARREEIVTAIREGLLKPVPTPAGRPEAEEINGRQDPRVAFAVPIRARTGSSNGVTGTLRDLSAGGLGVYLSRQLEPSEAITVSLDIQGHSLALNGYVQWAAEGRTVIGFPHGIRFAERQEASFPLYAYSFFREHQQPAG